MRPMNANTDTRAIDARHRSLVTVWIAILISVGMYVFLTRMTVSPDAVARYSELDASSRTILWACAALGVVTFLLSFVLKQMFLKKSVEKHEVQLVASATILALALCEATCLFGLLAYFVTHNSYAYLLFALAVLGMLLHFPRKAQLFEAAEVRPRFGM